MPTSPMPRVLRATSLVAVAGLVITGCSQNKVDSAPPGAAKVAIELTDDGCRPTPAEVPAGPVTFEVKNNNASKVSEAELMNNDVILGEKENLSPGLSGTFSLRLNAGKYTVYCPNAATQKTDFTVTGAAAQASQDPAVKTALDQAVTGYQQYVIAEVDKLVPATKQFTDAIRAGDVERAKQGYAPARYYYEEVEPVAESFGDLDPAIDQRADDVTDQSKWTGFHRLEKALWEEKSVDGMAPVADQLDADVAKLKTLVATAAYQPAQLANGATELLNEVANRKITGEEDRYSHADLSDFDANITGSKKAFDLLRPALSKLDPDLAESVAGKYADVLAALQPYKRDNGYVDYSTVGDEQRKALTQKVDALAEPLSQVSGKVNA
ncbi:iron uptake system protein EfeO [Amycolatopsis pigmentata]|uniref:Iron uptake system protein EfeO n=1 Tax=Amycolatopsis pigmentata TaxID=450801 RepID=A0ABW5FYX4_9PSEU